MTFEWVAAILNFGNYAKSTLFVTPPLYRTYLRTPQYTAKSSFYYISIESDSLFMFDLRDFVWRPSWISVTIS